MRIEPSVESQELRAIAALTVCFVKTVDEIDATVAPRFLRHLAALYDESRGKSCPEPWMYALKMVHDTLSYPGELRGPGPYTNR